MPIAVTDPATGRLVREYAPHPRERVERSIALAFDTAGSYRSTSLDQRAAWMHAVAGLLDAETDAIAATMTQEMGKTLAQARAEVAKCARTARFYAERTAEFLADEPVEPADVGALRAYARYEPLGVVLAVMPWNFPLWQAMRFAVPALMAGNVGLLKHASNVPATALLIESLFHRAGFPEGAFQTLLIGSGQVERVLRDPRVAAATLTGSEAAGRAVGRVAGEELKKVVLELGGSDPFIVLPSADLGRAAQVAAVARCQNNGQSCIAAKRFIVHAGVYDEFTELFVDRMARLVVGDPADPATDVGPLATEQGRREVEELVEDAVAKGARVLAGGESLPGPGWYYPPTVIADITPDMRVFGEEVFGPVASLYRASSLDDALDLANATAFGLGSAAWTTDPAEQDACVRRLAAGGVFINGMTSSHPQLPFGGVGASGHGRELSAHGIREFCNLKAVWVGP